MIKNNIRKLTQALTSDSVNTTNVASKENNTAFSL